jgi:hypothetical protein
MGFYRVSANVLGLSTAGVQRMVVDASGNVGIGTGSPTGKLHINAGSVSSDTYIERLSWSDSSGTNKGLLSFYSNSGADIRGFIGADNNGVLYLGDNGGGGVRFLTGGPSGTERMRIDASGNLLVGKTVASDTSQNGILIYGGPSIAGVMTATVSNDTGAINTYHVYNTSVAAYRFYVSRAGQINATSTSIAGISDISLKENIRDLETGLPEILALKPRRFDWKEETQLEQKNVAGFIAQELEEVLPELVYEYKYNETETKKSIKMGDILPTLVKAVQEQQTIIDELKAKVAALESK